MDNQKNRGSWAAPCRKPSSTRNEVSTPDASAGHINFHLCHFHACGWPKSSRSDGRRWTCVSIYKYIYNYIYYYISIYQISGSLPRVPGTLFHLHLSQSEKQHWTNKGENGISPPNLQHQYATWPRLQAKSQQTMESAVCRRHSGVFLFEECSRHDFLFLLLCVSLVM